MSLGLGPKLLAQTRPEESRITTSCSRRYAGHAGRLIREVMRTAREQRAGGAHARSTRWDSLKLQDVVKRSGPRSAPGGPSWAVVASEPSVDLGQALLPRAGSSTGARGGHVQPSGPDARLGVQARAHAQAHRLGADVPQALRGGQRGPGLLPGRRGRARYPRPSPSSPRPPAVLLPAPLPHSPAPL